MKRAFIAVIFFLSGWHSAFGQNANQLPNGIFEANVDGWTTIPGVPSTGTIEWRPVQGQPPGALGIVGEDQVAVTDLCFPTEDGIYLFRADAFADASAEYFLCNLNYALYETVDCSDNFGEFLDLDPVNWVSSINQWESISFDIVSHPPDFFGPDGFYKAVRPMLAKRGDVNDDDTCLFDNVYFQIIPATRIPTVSSVGLGVLAALLAAAALVVLRRVSTGEGGRTCGEPGGDAPP